MVNEKNIAPAYSSSNLDMSTLQARIRSTARKEKLKIILNIILIGLAFMLHFTAVRGLYSLQSTLHYKNKLGKITLSLHCSAIVLSNLFLSTAFVRWVSNTIVNFTKH